MWLYFIKTNLVADKKKKIEKKKGQRALINTGYNEEPGSTGKIK